jgi:hypothetical protein
MSGPAPNRCSAAKWPQAPDCAHGHAFTTACLFPEHGRPPMCMREDRRFDEARQVVTMGYYPPRAYGLEVKRG